MNRQENVQVNDNVKATRSNGQFIEGRVLRVNNEDILIETADGNMLVKWSGLISIQKI